MGEQGFYFRTKNQLAAALRVEQRLDAKVVARHEQTLARSIPDGERKNAVQPFDTARPPLEVSDQQYFRVAGRCEHMAELFEFPAQFPKIIDLAVV